MVAITHAGKSRDIDNVRDVREDTHNETLEPRDGHPR
jgi:hypothetical protein